MMVEERYGTRERPVVLPHARQRIKTMGLTDHRVSAALVSPEMEYRGAVRHPDGRRVAVAGDLAVVFDEGSRRGVVVVTVLWNRNTGRDE